MTNFTVNYQGKEYKLSREDIRPGDLFLWCDHSFLGFDNYTDFGIHVCLETYNWGGGEMIVLNTVGAANSEFFAEECIKIEEVKNNQKK